jgi:hypothetical protein
MIELTSLSAGKQTPNLAPGCDPREFHAIGNEDPEDGIAVI